MLIAHLIGGVIIFASFLLRTPQASSTLSLFLEAFKSVAPVSFLRQIEDVFSFSPAFIDSPSFYSDVVFSPSPAVTNLAVCLTPSQHLNSGFAENANISGGAVVWEIGQERCFLALSSDEENPVSTPATYLNIFFLLAPPCALLTLYLTYVSHQRPQPQARLSKMF